MGFDKIFEVLPQVNLFFGVNRGRRAVCDLLEHPGIPIRRVVACDQVFTPCDEKRFHRASKANGIPGRTTRPGVEDNVIANSLLHSFDAGHDLVYAAFCQEAIIGVGLSVARRTMRQGWPLALPHCGTRQAA